MVISSYVPRKYGLIEIGIRVSSGFLFVPFVNLATTIERIHKSQPEIKHVIHFLDKAS